MIMPTDKPDGIPQGMLDEMNRRLAITMNARNAAPDPEMGGLSPNQVTRLIYTEWGEPGAAVQFNTDIPLADLEKAEFFRKTRAFLKALHAAGDVRDTPFKQCVVAAGDGAIAANRAVKDIDAIKGQAYD